MKKRTLILLLAALLLLAAIVCLVLFGIVDSPSAEADVSATEAQETDGLSVLPVEASNEETTQASITLEGDSVSIQGTGAQADGTVITITAAGRYQFRGTLEDGQIIVDAGKEDDVVLLLSGVDITCLSGPPIYVKQANMAYIELDQGTENTLTDTANYVLAKDEDEPDATIFSKDDLALCGVGTLTINGNYNMAVHGKDTVTIAHPEINITAVGDGIKGKDEVRIIDATITICAGEDGIQSNNDTDEGMGAVSIESGTIDITAGKDGIRGESSLSMLDGTLSINAQADGIHVSQAIDLSGGTISIDTQEDGIQAGTLLNISGGTLNILTGGGAANAPEHTEDRGFPGWFDTASSDTEDSTSAKGLKSDGDLTVSGGTITLDCMDDALHCAGALTVSDAADLTIATGDDGLHSDDTLTITGGKIDISTSYEGLEAVFIEIFGGEIALVSSDDGLNAAGGSSADTDFDFMGPPGGSGTAETLEDATYYVHITGGILWLDASGDGLDSNGALFIDGGEVYVSGPSDSMNGGLDYTTTGQVNGGIVVVTGASGMAQNFDATSTQASVMYTFDSTIEAGSQVTLTDAAGTVLVETTLAKSFNNVVISLPELTVGETYMLTCGNQTAELTLTDTITTLGTSGGFGGGPGWMGGFGGGPGMAPPAQQ